MATIITINNKSPEFGKGTWLADNSTIIADVICGEDCSIWFQAVVRGDVGEIRIGDRVNIQDASIIHSTYGKSKVIIGNDVSIGHRAIIHGCTIEDKVLIGMGAIVMDNAIVERGATIAAGAVVLANTRVPAGTVYAGVPAKLVKSNEVEQAAESVAEIAKSYVKYKTWYTKN